VYQGKSIVITGGSSGVGKVLAGRLARRGAKLALLARDPDRLASVRDALGEPARVFVCDVTDATAVQTTMQAVAESQGPPHMLFNSAGILREGYFEKIPEEVFRQVMEVNFFGTLNCTRAVLPFFRENGQGRLVNMSSLAGLMGVFGYSAYCASKFAVKGLSDALRMELRPQNVKVHVVCAPEFDSPMVDEMNKDRTVENREVIHMLPVLSAQDVAQATLDGIERNAYLIVPGRRSRLVARLDRFFPGLSRKVMDGKVKKHYRGPGL
jgi:3-dehydrosphinganine reductase